MPQIRLAADCDTILTKFYSLQTAQDVATLLEIRLKDLNYYLYRPGLVRYSTFSVKKKAGGLRTLYKPIPGLKIIQQKLNHILSLVYKPRPSVHGFVSNRSIATNAQLHIGQQHVLNLDLSEFFPSINFGRVRGIFLARPFSLPPAIATILAQICCFENQLPQGAPTSPIISNIICSRLDSDLQRLAKRRRCYYSRFADDITFSCSESQFPVALAVKDNSASPSEVVIGEELENIISSNGFIINYKKVRLHSSKEHLEVTGLTVNEKVNVSRKYIRQIRAMLHAWSKFGLESAEQEYILSYCKKDRAPFRGAISFKHVLRGKIDFLAMVRGHDDLLYRNLLQKYAGLASDYVVPPVGAKTNHLSHPKDAIWILESESNNDCRQGTGFYLRGYGLVTCAHVILDFTWAFKPETPDRRYLVNPVKVNAQLDLAILEFPGPKNYQFIASKAPMKRGDLVTVCGFPNWAKGTTLWVDTGQVGGFRKWFDNPRAIVTCKIVAGASGSPVMDSYHRVVGVAARGPATLQAADQDDAEDFGVIFISDLDNLT